MSKEHGHSTDEQLLLHSAGELPTHSTTQIRAHLELCSRCCARLTELQSTMADFVGTHRDAWDAELPPVSASRDRLKARLAESVRQGPGSERFRPGMTGHGFWHSAWIAVAQHHQAAVLAGISLAACLVVAVRLYGPGAGSFPISTLGRWEEPDLRLTPGATVPVTQNQVCGASKEQTVPAVPASLKRKVFEEYGVTPPRPDAYEVDYLITPELGGATDIRNLWPEPYQDTVWNAHVKDQLEDRLRRMVCRGDVDLGTAQRDISTDWIAAYRKYFHADQPVSGDSPSTSALPKAPFL
jgi:hypothetical protein